jgi:hypothetical protein
LNPDDHFIGREPHVREIYDTLLRGVRKFGNVDVSPVKNGVMLKGVSTFLAVKPKKSWVDIEFILGDEISEYPVHKAVRYTKRKVAHFVRLERPQDVNRKLLAWLRKSFRFINSG